MEKKTPLYEEHVRAGARIVPFAGFLMPLQYSGIIDEHRAVRSHRGMFDLSHMGEFTITGAHAAEAIDRLVTNDILGLADFQVRYTPMCYPSGGIVDDLLVYRFPDHFMLVVNASNIDKDLAWIRQHLPSDVQVEDVSGDTALIAVQGPDAESLVQSQADLDLAAIPYYHFGVGTVAVSRAVVSRTGYTGEDGFELYVRPEEAVPLWRALLTGGEGDAVKPIGLGARDTLRLEAGYMLYGNDIDETTSPLEAGLGWTVKLEGADFIARDVLQQQKQEGLQRRMVAVRMCDRAIPRPHCAVRHDGRKVGELTSGTFSPTFCYGIGLGYVETAHAKAGSSVEVEVRDQHHPAQLVRKPMYKREGT